MRVYELNTSGGLLATALAARRATEPARTGLHVSTIVNDILRQLKPATYGRPMEEKHTYGYQEVGNVIEDLVGERLRARVDGWSKPVPVLFRGIIGSPDGFTPRPRTIDEIKVTWVKQGPSFLVVNSQGQIEEESLKFMAYRLQAMFYALAWDAARIRFHVLFVNPVPTPRTFILRVTAEDLERNYQILARHAVDRKLAGYEGVVPYLKAA